MIIKTNSRFGNFAYDASVDVSNGELAQLAAFGLLQVLQRSPSSAAEKAMAGYEKRPEGFSRDSIAFNAENAAKLQEALSSVEVKEAGKIVLALNPTVTVSEYVAAEAVQSKFTEEKAIIAKHEKAGDVRDWATNVVKFDGELFDEANPDGGPSVATTAFLTAVRAFKINALRGL